MGTDADGIFTSLSFTRVFFQILLLVPCGVNVLTTHFAQPSCCGGKNIAVSGIRVSLLCSRWSQKKCGKKDGGNGTMAGHLRRDNRINLTQFKNNGKRTDTTSVSFTTQVQWIRTRPQQAACAQVVACGGDGLEGPAGNIHQSMMIMASEIQRNR